MAKPTIDQIIARKKQRTKSVPVVIDADRASEIETARQALARAYGQLESLGPAVDGDDNVRRQALTERVEELRATMDGFIDDGSLAVFTFRAISRNRYKEISDANPAIDDKPGYGPEFPPMLVAACAIDPAISVDDALEMWDSDQWSDAELNQLFSAAVECCRMTATVPLGKDWSGTQN